MTHKEAVANIIRMAREAIAKSDSFVHACEDAYALGITGVRVIIDLELREPEAVDSIGPVNDADFLRSLRIAPDISVDETGSKDRS